MSRVLSVLAVVLCLAVFGAPVANALETRTVATQDGDKGKKKNQKKNQKKKKNGKKGKKQGKKHGKKGNKGKKRKKNS